MTRLGTINSSILDSTYSSTNCFIDLGHSQHYINQNVLSLWSLWLKQALTSNLRCVRQGGNGKLSLIYLASHTKNRTQLYGNCKNTK